MKLFHKIFLCFVVIFSAAFLIAGCSLISFAYGNAIEQEKKLAFQEFQYNKYILMSILYSEPDFFSEENKELMSISENFSVPAAVYGADGSVLFSNIVLQSWEPNVCKNEDDTIAFQICEYNGASYIFVYDFVIQNEDGMCLITQTDISTVIENQKAMIAYFRRLYVVFLCVSFPIIYLLTKMITASVKKVGKAAKRIAGGEYSERIWTKGSDEISELASDFNLMAEQVEKKIAELSDAARQKEDFTANFAHELKTPLTSVIGYADMLYQRDLPREEVRDAAEYILNEGMRLEALSQKLMDLFVLDKQDFFLESVSVREMFENLEKGIEPVCRKKETVLHLELEEGRIKADFDLFKTMVLNLADNAVKAESKDLWIIGKYSKDAYQFIVKDNGKGIPPEELGRITEAFYMVDKSRSRKQHGAGLGMALVSKIVEIHGGKMKIVSDGKTGTTVSILFQREEKM
ncbi:sensor histidine kinase [bacterium 1xD8-6]|nr:sensor histidine kinase [bacterium D16-36]RKI67893.1 sensor histidine kinase [bacterium 1xD8-6]